MPDNICQQLLKIVGVRDAQRGRQEQLPNEDNGHQKQKYGVAAATRNPH
jgi:hypothetical protein